MLKRVMHKKEVLVDKMAEVQRLIDLVEDGYYAYFARQDMCFVDEGLNDMIKKCDFNIDVLNKALVNKKHVEELKRVAEHDDASV